MDPQAAQSGVISRRQAIAVGLTDQDIRRLVTRREWARIHPGVYVNHTGPPLWQQQAWAAILYYWPAALTGVSALHAHGVRGFDPRPSAPVEVCVDRTRTVTRRIGIAVRQLASAHDLVQWNLAPPRLRVEHALLDVASRRARLDASIAVLADGVQSRHTTADRLATALTQRPKLRHRGLFREVLADVAEGAHSILEHRYLTNVERRHGLPRAVRQRRVVLGGHPALPDASYVEFAVTVELDGRLGHEASLDRWADLDRDLQAAVDGTLTLRAGWAQALDPCRLAAVAGSILQQRGWAGPVRPCGPMCTALWGPGRGDAVQIA